MHRARIAELLEPFLQGANDQRQTTNDKLYQDISTHIDLLLRWNARINLTAICDPEEIVTRHFGESLFAARHLFPKQRDWEGHDFSPEPALSKRSAPKGADNASEKNPASAPEGRVSANDQRLTTNDRPARLADLGSGAGFPGIPIKLWAPDIALTLIESNHKKAAFLREVTRALTLTDIDIQNARAETLSPATFDFVTLRAVERFSSILPIAAALLASSGRLALLIASSQLGQAHSTLPHLHWQPPIPIPQSKSRLLVVGLTEPQ